MCVCLVVHFLELDFTACQILKDNTSRCLIVEGGHIVVVTQNRMDGSSPLANQLCSFDHNRQKQKGHSLWLECWNSSCDLQWHFIPFSNVGRQNHTDVFTQVAPTPLHKVSVGCIPLTPGQSLTVQGFSLKTFGLGKSPRVCCYSFSFVGRSYSEHMGSEWLSPCTCLGRSLFLVQPSHTGAVAAGTVWK